MHVLVIGAAGMLGRKLSERLALGGMLGKAGVAQLTIADVVLPTVPPSMADRATVHRINIADAGAMDGLVKERPDIVVHLAAIVSGEAETNFSKGYSVNLDATRLLFEAIRNQSEATKGEYRPRLIFASSLAVYGAPLPQTVPDDFHLTPLTSYGTQKAICELLLADYSRRGFFDGIALRLPTICIRPGTPNKAASGFFSNILREPLAGRQAILPVSDEVRHWHASPRSAVGFFIHAMRLDLKRLGGRPCLTMPGLSATVGEQIEALRRIAGNGAVSLIRRVPDEAITAIIRTWPQDFDAACARELGFTAEASFDDIIRIHIEDELQGTIHADREVA